MTRRKVWIVFDCWGEYEDYGECPIIGFTSEEAANICARKRTERAKARAFGYFDDTDSFVREVEVVE